MTHSTKAIFSLVAGGLIAFSSCTSLRANMFLIKQTTPQEKAELLFEEGLSRYNEDLIDHNDLKAIPEIRVYFSDAIKLDPLHQKSQQYIKKIDAFKKNRFNEYIKTAQALMLKEKRTEAQNYALVLAIKRASDINWFDLDLIKLKNKSQKIRANCIQTRVDQITILEPKIIKEKNTQTLTKQLLEANKILTELQNIDPVNSKAIKSRKGIDAFVATLAQKDIDAAKEKLTAKKYAEAEASILKAEKSISTMTKEPNPQVQSLKYQIYYGWGTELLAAKKYQSAGDKASLALSVKETQEASVLKSKIAKAASVRDYDGDIENIIASVDLLISRNSLAEARTVIQTNLPRLKKQANKNALSAKTDELMAQMKQVYLDGITLYNEEDYEGARQKFRIVLRINEDYEQAQEYSDRTDTKIRALTGKD